MIYTYELPMESIEESLEEPLHYLLDGEPLHATLQLEGYEPDELLASQCQTAVIWDTADVLEMRPDLTRRQAWEVLKAAMDGHDADVGGSWPVIREYALDLYGLPFAEIDGGRP